MKAVRTEAIKLRKKGYSYSEINKELGVPKSTLSGWLSDVELSSYMSLRIQQKIKEACGRGLIKRNKEQTVKAEERAFKRRAEGAKNFYKSYKTIKKRDLLLLGVVLYWAEGYKKLKVINGKERMNHTISLTNSDPDMIKVFIIFLNEIIEVPSINITVMLRLFKHMDRDTEIKYWSNAISIPTAQFHRPSFVVSRSSKGIRSYNQLPHGTAQITVANTEKFHYIMGHLKALKEVFLR